MSENRLSNAGVRQVGNDYLEELERAKAQLLTTARDMGDLYRRERRQAERLQGLLDELHGTYLSTVETLAFVVEAKDEYTRHHLDRTRNYGLALARKVNPDLITPELEYGFLLHDVGKIGVPEAILSKPGPLSEEEQRLVRTHPITGVGVVSPLKKFLGDAVDVIRHHHEHYDGSGYPDGLGGENIPITARIFSVVDAFDAMTSDRPYRDALSVDEAVNQLVEGSGTQFDPEVVKVFMTLVEDIAL